MTRQRRCPACGSFVRPERASLTGKCLPCLMAVPTPEPDARCC